MKTLTRLFMAQAVLTLAVTPLTQAATYEIDSAHSSVEFKVKHLVGKVGGSLGAFTGTIDFDEADIAASRINAEVDAASIDTRNEGRDKHLKSPDFFDVAVYPKATFVSKSVDPEKRTITGDLTMRGVTKTIELTYEYLGVAQDKKGKALIGGTATGRVDRRDFGIDYDPTGLSIGHDVQLTLEIEAVQKSAEAPNEV